MTTDPDPPVAAALNAVPAPARARLLEIRALIFAAAEATGTAPLTETLKWGQPSYLPPRKQGTTIRLGAPDAETCALYVHCQTTLVDSYRNQFPTEFRYETNRAVLIPATGPYAQAALQQIAAMALTYHRDKHGNRT